MPADISNCLRTSENSGLGAFCQILLQLKQSTCFLSWGLRTKNVPSLLGGGDRRGRSEEDLVGWVTPGKPQSPAPSNPAGWVWVCMGMFPRARRVPLLTTLAYRGQQVTPSCTRPTPKLRDDSGWVLLGTHFLHVPMWQIISSSGFSHIIFHVGWSQPRKVLFSSPLTSIPSFPEFPSSPRPPVSDPSTALPVPYTFISVSLHLY